MDILRRRVGSSSSRIYCVVKHEMIPADGTESVGATVEPANTLDKVLVSPISQATKEEQIIIILESPGGEPGALVWGALTHISCRSEFKTAREQSSLMEASIEALEGKKRS